MRQMHFFLIFPLPFFCYQELNVLVSAPVELFYGARLVCTLALKRKWEQACQLARKLNGQCTPIYLSKSIFAGLAGFKTFIAQSECKNILA